ncbi:MAG TPA: endonuclease/exonuclease/phosphatase family protein [Candidatus Levybacteria bacterium]|nr:endonuclease/exonuclease/phosphatase family protein [Candidatus Levybacteria bacterium]
MTINLVSWNIWGGKNRADVIDFLRNTTFDVLALQEVTSREKNGEKENDAEVIAKSLGYHVAYAKSFTTDRHTPVYDIGNAIISKYPIQETTTHILSDLTTYEKNSSTEPRNAIQAEIMIQNTSVNFFSTHLGYSENLQATAIQLQQTQTLLSVLPQERLVLMGDFNSEPSSQTIKNITQKLVHVDSNLSQPSWTNFKKEEHPKRRIDYIFTSPDLKIKHFEMKNSTASDHLPLTATIEI